MNFPKWFHFEAEYIKTMSKLTENIQEASTVVHSEAGSKSSNCRMAWQWKNIDMKRNTRKCRGLIEALTRKSHAGRTEHEQSLSECQMSLARFEAGIFRIQMYSIKGALRLEDLMHLCNENQLDSLFTLSLFRHSTSTYFGYICSSSSGGILYIYNNCYVLCFLVDCLLASWWWVTNMPETCRGCLAK